MKKLLVIVIFVTLCALTTSAQRLAIGVKLPDVKTAEWLIGNAPSSGRATYIEFFHPKSAPSLKRTSQIVDIASKYKTYNVVVISVEDGDLKSIFANAPSNMSITVDSQKKISTMYEIQYIPFGIILDSKGRIAWIGNPSQLTDKELSSVSQ